MDNAPSDYPWAEAEIPRAEVVEITAGSPWQASEMRPAARKRGWRMPLLLLVITCLSTWWAGAQMGSAGMGQLGRALYGLRYAVPVMMILLCHEMGHFIQAHRYGVYASWPYFLPMPFSPFGTLGAVIAMEPRVGAPPGIVRHRHHRPAGRDWCRR